MSRKRIGEHLENLSEDFKVYFKSEIAYYKLDVYKKLIKATSFLLRLAIIFCIVLILMGFFSIALGLWLGELFGHNYLGFLTIAGVYLILFFLMIVFGKDYFDNKILKIFNKIFKEE